MLILWSFSYNQVFSQCGTSNFTKFRTGFQFVSLCLLVSLGNSSSPLKSVCWPAKVAVYSVFVLRKSTLVVYSSFLLSAAMIKLWFFSLIQNETTMQLFNFLFSVIFCFNLSFWIISDRLHYWSSAWMKIHRDGGAWADSRKERRKKKP